MPLSYLRANGNDGRDQLYIDGDGPGSGGLFNLHRESQCGQLTWRCVDYAKLCKCIVKTVNGEIVQDSKVNPHFGHDYITRQDYLCRLALVTMKQRVRDDINIWPSKIYNEERSKLKELILLGLSLWPQPSTDR